MSPPPPAPLPTLGCRGPILDVDLDALLLTWYALHPLNRPWWLMANVVTIGVRERQKTQVPSPLMGSPLSLEEGDEVTIEKARSKALIIASPQRNYYEVIRDKLNWSGECLRACRFTIWP